MATTIRVREVGRMKEEPDVLFEVVQVDGDSEYQPGDRLWDSDVQDLLLEGGYTFIDIDHPVTLYDTLPDYVQEAIGEMLSYDYDKIDALTATEAWDLYLKYEGIIGFSEKLHEAHEAIFKKGEC